MSLQALLESRNISMYRLSKLSGVPKTTIVDICSGKTAIGDCKAKTVHSIASALNVSVESLLAIYLEASENVSGFDANGLPADKTYLECGLPDYLYDSIAAMRKTWDLLDSGKRNTTYDLDYCELQADINRAEVDKDISSSQAWYLRKKYLRTEYEGDFL